MIRPLNSETDAAAIVELIHEIFPSGVTTEESWRQQLASIPARARNAAWVTVVDGAVVAWAQASLNAWSGSETAFAGVSVREEFRRRGIATSLWECVEDHLRELAPTRVLSWFVETPDGVAFARSRGFAEERADTLAFVDPRTVDVASLDSARGELVPLQELAPEAVYEVDMVTTRDVPMTDSVDDMRYDDWLNFIWRRPTMRLDGSFAAIEEGRPVAITMLAANLEKGRAFNEYTGTLPSHRGRGLARLVKLASLRWAAEQGITSVWTTNDETNAPMVAVNRRLGYEPRLRRVEYLREAETAS